uniref:CTCK domain-containing protein n=1 Tax=Syphacia muris TaxID=451379 RepID=A0A0N5AEE9_9BILA
MVILLKQSNNESLENDLSTTTALFTNETNIPGLITDTQNRSSNFTVFPNESTNTVQVSVEKPENTLAELKPTTVPFESSTDSFIISSERTAKKERNKEELRSCKKYTECELYQKLEEIGARNQQFMANSPEEAAKNFATLIDTYEHQQISSLFYDVSLLFWITVEAHNSETVDQTSPCRLEQFVPVGNCTLRGSEEVDGYEKLCSSCHGIYILSNNCFPRFLNSVTCDNDDGKCIFDMTSKAYGKCHLQTLSFQVLYNRGTLNCENWTRVFIDVPIACECYLGVNALGLSATLQHT